MNRINLALLATLVLMLSACFPSNKSGKEEILLQGRTMGTSYNIKVVATKTQVETLNLRQNIDAVLEQLNQEMSTYISDSELSRFNQSRSIGAIEISPGLTRVIRESLRIGQLTEGALDVTLGPLVNLWGFGPEFRAEKVPNDDVLRKTKELVGLQHLYLNGNQLSKSLPALNVDLSTIAKGYGVDIVAELIEKNGITNYLVEIGGELRLKGFKATGELWAIAIEKPMSNERIVQQIIIPKDNAVATSGDYRNYFEIDGIRFSHIIDPKTGKPINHKLVSVTVIHPSSMTADGLSTALMVMGVEQGMNFALDNNLAALFITKTADGFDEQFTVKFKQYLK